MGYVSNDCWCRCRSKPWHALHRSPFQHIIFNIEQDGKSEDSSDDVCVVLSTNTTPLEALPRWSWTRTNNGSENQRLPPHRTFLILCFSFEKHYSNKTCILSATSAFFGESPGCVGLFHSALSLHSLSQHEHTSHGTVRSVHVVDPHTRVSLGSWPMKLDNSGFKRKLNTKKATKPMNVSLHNINKMYYSIRLLFLILAFQFQDLYRDI